MQSKKSNQLVQLKKYLRTKTQRELIDEISGLYKSFDNVKEHYQSSFFKDDKAVLDKYKLLIEYEFLPKSSKQFPMPKISSAKRAIRDYKKISCSHIGMADIMLFYVENVLEYLHEYSDPDVAYYNSLISMYREAIIFISRHDLTGQFIDRISTIYTDSDKVGYGVFEAILDINDTYVD